MSNKPLKIAKFLLKESDLSCIWDDHIGYTKQYVFKDYSYQEIQEDSSLRLKWYRQQERYWGRGCVRLINSNEWKGAKDD